MPKPLKHHEFLKRLRKYQKRSGRKFELDESRGKGSHRYLKELIDGVFQGGIPLTWHKGKDLKKGILEAIIRRFNLPNDIFD